MASFWWRCQITSSKWRHKIFIFKPPLLSKILVAPLLTIDLDKSKASISFLISKKLRFSKMSL